MMAMVVFLVSVYFLVLIELACHLAKDEVNTKPTPPYTILL